MKTFKEYLDEVLDPSKGAGEYVKDFRKSDAPQFKGKSKEKRTQMAIAAYMAAKRKNEEVELEEEQLDELSKGTLKSYADKAVNKAAAHAYIAGGGTGQDNLDIRNKEFNTAVKRVKGVQKATAKLAKEEVELDETEQLDEISKELARKYMAKAGKQLDKGAGDKADKRIDGYWGASKRLSDEKPTSK